MQVGEEFDHNLPRIELEVGGQISDRKASTPQLIADPVAIFDQHTFQAAALLRLTAETRAAGLECFGLFAWIRIRHVPECSTPRRSLSRPFASIATPSFC